MGNCKTSEVKIIYSECGVMYTADICVVNYDPDCWAVSDTINCNCLSN